MKHSSQTLPKATSKDVSSIQVQESPQTISEPWPNYSEGYTSITLMATTSTIYPTIIGVALRKWLSGKVSLLFTVGSNEHVQKEIEDLKSLIEETEGGLVDQYKARLSMLNGKYATITVGGATQAEGLETKDRVDDAIFAVGAAQRYGYLPGGGVALRDASNAIAKKKGETPFDAGYNFLLRSIYAPYFKILENAGYSQDQTSETIKFDGMEGKGIDASKGIHVNMEEAGIIDPAFVTESALRNSVSAASTLLLTKATLIIVKDETNQ